MRGHWLPSFLGMTIFHGIAIWRACQSARFTKRALDALISCDGLYVHPRHCLCFDRFQVDVLVRLGGESEDWKVRHEWRSIHEEKYRDTRHQVAQRTIAGFHAEQAVVDWRRGGQDRVSQPGRKSTQSGAGRRDQPPLRHNGVRGLHVLDRLGGQSHLQSKQGHWQRQSDTEAQCPVRQWHPCRPSREAAQR